MSALRTSPRSPGAESDSSGVVAHLRSAWAVWRPESPCVIAALPRMGVTMKYRVCDADIFSFSGREAESDSFGVVAHLRSVWAVWRSETSCVIAALLRMWVTMKYRVCDATSMERQKVLACLLVSARHRMLKIDNCELKRYKNVAVLILMCTFTKNKEKKATA